MLPVEDPRSIESRLDKLVGYPLDYKEENILKHENPEEQVARLERNISAAFRLLNSYYKLLRDEPELKLQFMTNAEDSPEIAEFQMKQITRTDTDGRVWCITPMGKDGDSVEVASGDTKYLREIITNFDDQIDVIVSISGFSDEALEAIKVVFGKALMGLLELRKRLERIQQKMRAQGKYESDLQTVAAMIGSHILSELGDESVE